MQGRATAASCGWAHWQAKSVITSQGDCEMAVSRQLSYRFKVSFMLSRKHYVDQETRETYSTWVHIQLGRSERRRGKGESRA
jgi:hypothetical protein